MVNEYGIVLKMFQHSEELHDAKYRCYIGDGDTKTFKAFRLNALLEPYREFII